MKLMIILNNEYYRIKKIDAQENDINLENNNCKKCTFTFRLLS